MLCEKYSWNWNLILSWKCQSRQYCATYFVDWEGEQRVEFFSFHPPRAKIITNLFFLTIYKTLHRLYNQRKSLTEANRRKISNGVGFMLLWLKDSYLARLKFHLSLSESKYSYWKLLWPINTVKQWRKSFNCCASSYIWQFWSKHFVRADRHVL